MSEIKAKLLELIMSMSEAECGEVIAIMSTPICKEAAREYMAGQITQQEFDRIVNNAILERKAKRGATPGK